MNCPSCKSKDVNFLRAYRGKSFVFGNRKLLECNNCKLVFTDPLLSDKDLNNYNSSYFENAHGGSAKDPITIAFHSGINKVRGRYIQNLLKPEGVQFKRILEIGPGQGFIADFFKQMDPEIQYTVVETDTLNLLELKKKVDFAFSSLKEVKNLKYDLVVMSHVLEHSNNPISFLSEILTKLKPGGYLFVEVPNSDYKFKDSDEPHLLFFNQIAIENLMKFLNLKCLKISTHGPKITEGFLNKFLKRIYFFLDKKLNQRNILFPSHIFYPSLGSFLSKREIVSILPFDPIKDRSDERTWLRILAKKTAD